MTGRRRGLGRGLDALLGPEQAGHSGVTRLAVHLLDPNPYQPRVDFEDEDLEELARSIEAQGVVQPLVVTPRAEGRYVIVAGERRWRAAQKAGLDEVPVVVRDVPDDRTLLELALVENLQRSDLNPVEEALAYQELRDGFGLSQEETARRVGKSRSAVANALRLLRLPDDVLALLRQGRLTAGQARPLLSLPTASHQSDLARRAVEEELSARELEHLTARERERDARPKDRGTAEVPDVHTRRAEERLTRRLQTKVDIRRRRTGGMIRIHFHSEEELIRLYERLISKGDEP